MNLNKIRDNDKCYISSNDSDTQDLDIESDKTTSEDTESPENKDIKDIDGGHFGRYMTDDEVKHNLESKSMGNVAETSTADTLYSNSNSLVTFDKTTTSDVSSDTKKHKINKWISVADVNLNLAPGFENDGPDLMSTLANPSEQEYKPTLKWREIFKLPEVWKQTRPVTQNVKEHKAMGLVKVHGQYRQTMLK